MKKVYEELKARYMNLLTDFGFHKIFADESNKELLINFLNEIIKEEGLITDIQYLLPEQWGNFRTDRKAVFDIFCETEKGEFFIVEMQNAKQPFFRDRSIFYASLPIQKQAPKGVWNFRLKAVYLVAILDFLLFEDNDQVVERVQLVRENTKTVYSNKLKFAFVELPKFKKTEKELLTNFDKWMFILKNMPKLKDRPDSFQGSVFEKLFELAEMKQLTKKDMGKYRKSILEYADVRGAVDLAREEAFEEAREKVREEVFEEVFEEAFEKGIKKGSEKGRKEGIKEGIKEGREEEKISIIQKCLQKNMVIEDIVFLTGFSKEKIIHYRMSNSDSTDKN